MEPITVIVRFMGFDQDDYEQNVRTISIHSEMSEDSTVEAFRTMIEPAVQEQKDLYRQSVGEDTFVDAEILAVCTGHVTLFTFQSAI